MMARALMKISPKITPSTGGTHFGMVLEVGLVGVSSPLGIDELSFVIP